MPVTSSAGNLFCQCECKFTVNAITDWFYGLFYFGATSSTKMQQKIRTCIELSWELVQRIDHENLPYEAISRRRKTAITAMPPMCRRVWVATVYSLRRLRMSHHSGIMLNGRRMLRASVATRSGRRTNYRGRCPRRAAYRATYTARVVCFNDDPCDFRVLMSLVVNLQLFSTICEKHSSCTLVRVRA